MSLTNTTNRKVYTGDGGTTSFAFPYQFIDDSDLVVKLLDTNGQETTPVLNTDYTVTGGGDAAGTIEFVVAPVAAYTVTIYRDPSLTQNLNMQANDSFPAESLEEALDKQAMILIRAAERLNRSLTLSESDSLVDMSLPLLASRASKYLGFDASGLPIAVSSFTPGVTASAYIQTLLVAATAAAARTILGFDGSGNLTTSLLADSAVTTVKLNAKAVTLAKLDDLINPTPVSAVKTTTYVVLSTDSLVQLDPVTTAPFTATLPTPVGISGKEYVLLHVGPNASTATGIAKATIATAAGSIKERGALSSTTSIDTPGESIRVKSDNSNWIVMHRYIPSIFKAYDVSAAFTGFGSVVGGTGSWQRIGGSVRIMAQGTTGTTTAVEARLALPSAITGAIDVLEVVGAWSLSSNAAVGPTILQENAKAYMTFGFQGASNAGMTKLLGSTMLGNGVNFAINALIPITGWNG